MLRSPLGSLLDLARSLIFETSDAAPPSTETGLGPLAAGDDDASSTLLPDLPDVVILEIVGGLQLSDAHAFCRSCRSIAAIVAESVGARLSAQFERTVRHFPRQVVASVPGAVWMNVEWIEWQPHWTGSTGYVDNVRRSDLPGNPFRCARDAHGRLMLLMRLQSDVAVLFQRYTDSVSTWAFASRTLPIGGCRLSDSMVARLALWLANDYADPSPLV